MLGNTNDKKESISRSINRLKRRINTLEAENKSLRMSNDAFARTIDSCSNRIARLEEMASAAEIDNNSLFIDEQVDGSLDSFMVADAKRAIKEYTDLLFMWAKPLTNEHLSKIMEQTDDEIGATLHISNR